MFSQETPNSNGRVIAVPTPPTIKKVLKHFCGLGIMILSVKRWSLIKSRLSCFLLAC